MTAFGFVCHVISRYSMVGTTSVDIKRAVWLSLVAYSDFDLIVFLLIFVL